MSGPDQAASRNPYVFIVGCPRSGTTLLKRMVDAHPQLAITPETHWVPRCPRKGIGIDDHGLVTSELRDYLRSYHKFGNLRIDPADLDALFATDPPLDYAAFVSRIFDLFGRRKGKRLVGDKTPGYARDLPLLHGLWPRARFVHLVRDGRDICLSVLNWKRSHRNVGRFEIWAEDPVTTIALWWERFIRTARRDAATLDSLAYHEVRYEDLLASPRPECEGLCAFLDLPFEEAMVRFHEGKTKSEAGLSAKRSWLPLTRGLRDWRTQLAPDDVERFEAATGDLLDELGYARGCPEPSAAARQRAASLRQRFESDPRAQKRRAAAMVTPSRS